MLGAMLTTGRPFVPVVTVVAVPPSGTMPAARATGGVNTAHRPRIPAMWAGRCDNNCTESSPLLRFVFIDSVNLEYPIPLLIGTRLLISFR